MKGAKHKHLVIRFYLPLILVSILLAVAFLSAWYVRAEQHGVQLAQEQLRSFELKLFQMREAAFTKGIDTQVLYNQGTTLLEEPGEKWAEVNIISGQTSLARTKDRLLQNWQQIDPFLPRDTTDVQPEELQRRLRLILQQETELQADYSHYGLKLEAVLRICLYGGFILLFLLLLYIVHFIRNEVWSPLKRLEDQTEALLEGRELQAFQISEGSLYQQVVSNVWQHNQQLHLLSGMAEEIGEGNFSQEAKDFEIAGALGSSIGRMREKISLSFQDEEKRRWSNEGISHFSTMVRENNQSLDQLCTQVLYALVPFVQANQGGLFIKEEQEHEVPLLQLKAAYAWGRRKHCNKQYYIGEGLIGQAAQDMDMILITDVPDDFITIGSGLGHAKPGCILILPLISGEQLFGVLEIASFQVFQEYQMGFLQKLCEILASAIAVARGNSMTARLLKETEEANQQLKAQEEELRQNTEELMATQEAMRRKEKELEVKLQEALREMELQIKGIQAEKVKNDAILEGCVDGIVSFNQKGIIEYFNSAAEEIWELPRQQVLGRSIYDLIPVEIREEAGELFVYYAKNGILKVLDARTEVPVKGRAGQEMEVLLTLARVKVEGAYTFTAFAQRVAVELF